MARPKKEKAFVTNCAHVDRVAHISTPTKPSQGLKLWQASNSRPGKTISTPTKPSQGLKQYSL
jgi:hypothetical protein